MQTAVFIPAYFAPVDQFAHMLQADEILIEKHDFYRKQTYRTRMHIYGANGLLKLYIPVKHSGKELRLTAEVEIENAFPWQRNHFRSLNNAYRSSPFFEYYEDDIRPLYEKKYDLLFDFLMDSLRVVFRLLDVEKKMAFTNEYKEEYSGVKDFRNLIDAKQKRNFPLRYTQIFEPKHGFIPGLNVLDLLFHEGPNSLSLFNNMY